MASSNASVAERAAAAQELSVTGRNARAAVYKTFLDAAEDPQGAQDALLALASRGIWSVGSPNSVVAEARALAASGIGVESAPTFTSITPATGVAAGGTAVALVGTNFKAGAVVKFGTANATSVVVVDTDHITCVTPAVAAGTVSVTVVTDIGTSNGHNYVYT